MVNSGFDLEEVILSPAEPAELAQLSDLAERSKAHWGYPQEWLLEWRPQLTITPDMVVQQTIIVARYAGRAIGFYCVELSESVATLEHFWVEPAFIGAGVGRLLFRDAQCKAEERGCRWLQIDSDPNAEAFYLRMGAVRVGAIDASVLGVSRHLPRLRIEVGRRDA